MTAYQEIRIRSFVVRHEPEGGLGRWPEAAAILADLDDIVQEGGYTLLPILPTHAMRAGRLPMQHRGPFDRLLAATALHEDYGLCSADTALDVSGVRRIW